MGPLRSVFVEKIMADKMEKPKTIVIVDDRLWRSVARDTYTFGLLTAVTAVGYFLDISALSWIGGLMWIVVIIARSDQRVRNSTMTIKEARKLLDQLEAD